MRGKYLHSELRYKRLEKDKVPWPRNEEAAREITVDQLRMLLDGVDFWKAHQKLAYTTVL
jgi:transposase